MVDAGAEAFLNVYEALLAEFGPQYWWPADDGPFEVMVGAVLTQNTAWSNVERAIANLKQAGMLSAEAITRADHETLTGWLRPSGYFNIKARRLRSLCEWLIECGGYEALQFVPTNVLRRSLLAVYGVGPETADDILLYAFNRPVFVIDAYTRRLFTRLGLVDTHDYESLRSEFESRLPVTIQLFNEYHALIVSQGKGICRPKPRCMECCLAGHCAYFRQQKKGVSK